MPDANEILKQRALRLAVRPRDEKTVRTLDVVEFLLAHETYGIESDFVREVYPLKDLTPLPGTPDFILGVVGIRGHILSIVDLRRFFDLPVKGLTDLNKLIVLTGEGMEFGLLTDAIVGLRRIPMDAIQSSLEPLTGIPSDFLKGVTPERCVVLDAARLLSDPRLLAHQTVE